MVAILQSWNEGYRTTYLCTKQQEAACSKGYYVSVFWQVLQVANALTPFSSISLSTRLIAPLVSLPLFFLQAIVAEGDLFFCSTSFQKGCQRLIETQAIVIQIVAFSTLLGLTWMGSVSIAPLLILSLGYGVLEAVGVIPEKVAYFLQKYMPAFTFLEWLLRGVFPLKIGALFMLMAYVSSHFQQKCFYALDRLLRSFISLQGSSLEKNEAPFREKKCLSHEEINNILLEREEEYELNLSHCRVPFPGESREKAKYAVFKDLMDLVKNFSFQDLKEAQEKGWYPECQDVDAFQVVVLGQLKQIEDVLEGRKKAIGSLQDLMETRELFFSLSSLWKENDDLVSLLQLAREGYSGSALTLKNVLKDLRSKTDVSGNCRKVVWQKLYDCRVNLVRSVYRQSLKRYCIPDRLVSDATIFEWCANPIAWGFLPVSTKVSQVRTWADFFYWEKYSTARAQMHRKYRQSLYEILQEEFNKSLFKKIITDNSKLTPEQKKELESEYDHSGDKNKYHRLCLVQLGILCKIQP